MDHVINLMGFKGPDLRLHDSPFDITILLAYARLVRAALTSHRRCCTSVSRA